MLWNAMLSVFSLVMSVFVVIANLWASSTTGNKIFYFETEKSQCSWILHDLDSNAKRILITTKGCPEEVIWDLAHQRTVYMIDRTIFSLKSERGATPQVVATLPQKYVRTMLAINENGRLRAASEELVPENNVKKTQIGQEQKINFDFEGKSYDGSSLPNFGSPYIVVVREFDKDEGKVISIKPTRDDAGETPGFMEVAQEMKSSSQTISLRQLLQRGTYGEQADRLVKISGWSKIQKDTLAKLMGIKGEAPGESLDDELAFLPADGLNGVLMRTAMGDSMHFMTPIFFCRERCQKSNKLEINSGQISVSRRGDYIIVADEYTNEDARVFKFLKAKPVFDLKGATSVVWAPEQLN